MNNTFKLMNILGLKEGYYKLKEVEQQKAIYDNLNRLLQLLTDEYVLP